jgi:DNA primase
MYDEPDNISRFKLRKPASSDFQWIDDRFDAELSKFRGFYGLNYYKEFFGDAHNPKAKFAVVVEGEFDAISPIEQQAKSGEVEFIALATGGKGTQLDRGSVDRLVNLGITTIGIIPDRDKGGVGFVQHILSQSQSDALNFKILQWPDFAGEDADSDDRIKDPDEWINRRSYTEFSRFIRQEDSYQQPHQWVFEQISELMMRIPPDDIRQKSRLAIEWGKYLQNPVECRAFCKNLQKAFELDDVVLFREIQAREEDEDAYIVRIHDTLKQLFYAVGVETIEHGKRRVELWHKATRTTVYATLNDAKGIESMLSLYYGKNKLELSRQE